MIELALARCARPKVGGRSTYTVLGFLGYGVASMFGAVLASVWGLTLGERLIAIGAPPIAFIIVVTCATALRGREWIVFYQTMAGGVVSVVALGLAIDGHVPRLLDIAVLGTGVFLVIGRIGCFHVACCHGRPARHGVVYGAAHVAVGFWRRWSGRPLFPIQLVESAGTLGLVIAGLVVSETPGAATLAFTIGYAIMRFGLELLRGDPVRPFAYGLSEGQWWSLASAGICAVVHPSMWTVGALCVVSCGAIVLVARRRARELGEPPHLHELDAICDQVLADPAHARRDTRLGVGVSLHVLPDGRRDWILSSAHPRWSPAMAHRIAMALWPSHEIVKGRSPGVVHVIVAAS